MQNVHEFLLAESLSGEKRNLSSSHWALLSSWGMRAPPSGLRILSDELPRTEEPGRLQSMGSQRVGHD